LYSPHRRGGVDDVDDLDAQGQLLERLARSVAVQLRVVDANLIARWPQGTPTSIIISIIHHV
jgi:hypothetical protein